MSIPPPLQLAAGLASGSIVHGALTADWLLATIAIVATALCATVGALTREVR